eukprot:760955-Hanusia_phi.AAC.4
MAKTMKKLEGQYGKDKVKKQLRERGCERSRGLRPTRWRIRVMDHTDVGYAMSEIGWYAMFEELERDRDRERRDSVRYQKILRNREGGSEGGREIETERARKRERERERERERGREGGREGEGEGERGRERKTERQRDREMN